MRSAAVSLLTACVALAFAAAAHAQPNVVLIVTDDQRWDTLQHMPIVRSELVGKGVTFSNAFAVNPLCCPSRATILTGLYSHSNGVWTNKGRWGGLAVFDERSTVPTWLNSVGYETAFMGKYLNGYYGMPYVPVGWDRWRAFFPAGYFRFRLTDGADIIPAGGRYSTDVLAAAADDFIRSAKSPFFLFFAPYAPHQSGPFRVPAAPRHAGTHSGAPYVRPISVNEVDMSDKPSFTRRRGRVDGASLAKLREEQLDSLLAVDEAVGRMIAALENTGKLADTLILFTSDNGLTWGEHRWAGRKRVPYEESIRVPFVIRWDSRGVSARTEDRFALNVDLAPTIAAAAGVPVKRREGRSLIPLLTGDPVAWRSRFLIESFMPSRNLPPYCGFRDVRWKYVQYGNGEEELYNMPRDPYELHNKARRDALTPNVMHYRGRVLRSRCRPPGFEPLPQCTRVGTRARDRLVGSRREDWICAGRGNDRILVRGDHRDVIRCGPGRDRVRADRHDSLRSCEIRLR